jgi:hypothetical protein
MAHDKGTVYFMVSYLDDDSLVPVMETVVYLGQELSENAAPRHMFQDFESWKERGAYPNNEEGPGKVFSLPSTELSNIQSLESALLELADCQARRKRRGLN